MGSDCDSPEDWKRAHAELIRLARQQAALDGEEGTWLLRALRAATHLRLGFASFAEYAGRLFGHSPRLVSEKLRVAEALEQLPQLAAALEAGQVSWSALRELTRVATPATEGEWLRAATGRSVRDIEQLVSGRRPGDGPEDRFDPEARRHVLRFDVSAETLATFREMMAKIRRDAGAPLDDDAALLVVARHVLGGPTDAGRASYQVLLTRCEECGRGRQEGRGELLDVDAAVVAMAECDAQHVVGAGASANDGAAGEPRASDTHVGVPSVVAPGRPTSPRATQSIPPAVRRLVLRRDHGRCVVPGCRHAVFVDVHHLRPRSEGGDHEPDGMATLCSAHHRAVHRGELTIEGTVRDGLVVRHADGSTYGGAVSPKAAEVRAKLYGALRGLGFRETETKRALAGIQTHVGAGEPLEKLLRRALLLLSERRVAS